jgi:hypothetical protein
MIRIHLIIPAALTLCTLALSVPADAEVKAQSDAGFNVVHIAEVEATPDDLWKRLISPKDYWSKEHSWSGSSAGFFIDAQAGGCFCELMQDKDTDVKAKSASKPAGSVEHMRVIFAQPGKVLRMQGALGPLQSEAVLGTLTVAMQPLPAKNGGKPLTKLSFSYVVGGYMRYKVSEIAPAVDKVIGEQFASLIKPFTKTGKIADKASNWSLDLEGIEDSDKPAGDTSVSEDEPVIVPEKKAVPKDKSPADGVKKPVPAPAAKPAPKPAAKPAPKPSDVKKER